MKTKAILATLLVAAAVKADARFAWPYPPKAVSPNEIGRWVVISGNAWPDSAEPELITASLSGGGPDGLNPRKSREEIQSSRLECLILEWPASAPCSPDFNAFCR